MHTAFFSGRLLYFDHQHIIMRYSASYLILLPFLRRITLSFCLLDQSCCFCTSSLCTQLRWFIHVEGRSYMFGVGMECDLPTQWVPLWKPLVLICVSNKQNSWFDSRINRNIFVFLSAGEFDDNHFCFKICNFSCLIFFATIVLLDESEVKYAQGRTRCKWKKLQCNVYKGV